MYKKSTKKISLFLAFSLLLALFTMTSISAADEYTLYQGVKDGHIMTGGLEGYYIVYQNSSITNPTYYLDAIDDGIISWNRSYRQTGFSFDYAAESDSANYNRSKLRFVVSNYGESFRGHTIRYSAAGFDTLYEIPSYGPSSNWSYAVIRLNNERIESDDSRFRGEDYYSKYLGIQCTAAHEIGHALGLDHHTVDGAVLMASSFESRFVKKGIYSPTSDDIAGVVEAYVTGISTNEEVTTQSIPQPKQSLEAFTASYDRVQQASFRGYGDIIGLGNGIINLAGHIMDDTAYYVECLFETPHGEIIRALEYIGFGAERSMQHVLPKQGQYLLFLSESNGYYYLVDPDLSLQHVVNGEVIWNPTAQASINLPSTRMDINELTE